MKKKTLLILAVLITALACIFTSCSASVELPKAEEEFGYVTFGNGGSRSLSTEYGVKSYNQLYWYYTAVKQDGFGLTGQKTEQTRLNDTTGLSGEITLSQGAWKFNLYAYESVKTDNTGNNLVYHGESATIVLKGGETKAVPVSVSLKGDFGTLDFSDAYFAWYKETADQVVGTGDVYLRINISGTPDNNSGSLDRAIITKVISPNYKISNVLIFDDSYGANKFPAGYYTCTVQAYVAEDLNSEKTTVNPGSTYKASQAFGLRVYGNAITKIKGDLTEGLFAEVSFDVAKQDMKVFVPVSNDITTIDNINVVPDATAVEGVEKKSTTVEFERGALTSVADKTLQLDVKVTTVEAANNKFNISGTTSDNKSAFAGIDVTLWATDTTGTNEVNNFTEDTFATVTTYIAKGLSGVVVKYNGTDGKSDPIASSTGSNVADTLTSDTDTSLGYNPNTGLLRFKTSHFSEYYVLADCKIVNTTTNVGYSDFAEGYTDANNGDVLIITADEIDFPVELSEKDNITIKGRSDINKTKVRLLKTLNEGMNNLVMENLDFIQTSTLTIQGSSITFNNCDFSAKETSYSTVPLELKNGYYTDITTIKNASNIVFNGCTFSGRGTDDDLPNARLISSPTCTNLTINESIFEDCFSCLWYSNVSGMLKVNSSTFNSYAYTIHSGGDYSCEIAVSDSSLNGWTSFASSTNTSASFDRCSFGKYNGYNCMATYMNTKFNECYFDLDYEIYNRYETQKSIYFDKCKKGETDITKDNFISLFKNENDEETVYLWNRSNCYVNGALLEKDAAEINKKFYVTLEDAVRAAVNNDIIVLQKSTSGNGIGLYEGGDNNTKIATKNITIDFNNFTYTIDGTLQGSTGTVSQAFHLEKDCSVTLKNGILTSSNASMLIQNYCDLTLDNMNLIFEKNYPLSNNSGNIIIKDTTITANDGQGIAFDVYSFGDYNGTTVTVIGNSIINGKVELDRTNNADLKLVIEGGEFKNDICKEVSSNCIVEIKGGTFSKDPTNYVDTNNYNVTENDDSTWTVTAKN